MENENVLSPTIARISDLLNRHYGCEFDFQTADDLGQAKADSNLSRLQDGQLVRTEDWIFIPIFSAEKNFAGAARISHNNRLSNDDAQYLNQVIRSLLENRMAGAMRVESLESLENQIHMLRDESAKKNIITLSHYQVNPAPLIRKTGVSAMNFPFLVESKSAEDIYKMALEIHSRTNRYAFLNIADISTEALLKPDSIKRLGHITIFIPEITRLTYERQSQLLNYYQSDRDKDCPQVIAGTTLPASEIKRSGLLADGLLPVLMVGYLNMAQPFALYKKENVLQFFYESLTGHTSI